MKRLLPLLLAALLIFASACSKTEPSDTPADSVPDGIKVMLNGEYLVFDVPPQIVDGQVLVPMQETFEKLGAAVFNDVIDYGYSYDEDDDGIVTFVYVINQNVLLRMRNGFYYNEITSKSEKSWRISSRTPDSDYIDIESDVQPTIIDEIMFVPVSLIFEMFDGDVNDINLDSETQTVAVTIDIPKAWKTQEEVDMMHAFEYSADLQKVIDAYMTENRLDYVPGHGLPNWFEYDFNGKSIGVVVYPLSNPSNAYMKLLKFYYDGSVGVEKW